MFRVGGAVSRTTASLRIGGDDLDPDEITALLRCEPTNSHRKGDIEVGSSTGKKYINPHSPDNALISGETASIQV